MKITIEYRVDYKPQEIRNNKIRVLKRGRRRDNFVLLFNIALLTLSIPASSEKNVEKQIGKKGVNEYERLASIYNAVLLFTSLKI